MTLLTDPFNLITRCVWFKNIINKNIINSVEYNSFGIPHVIVLKFMIKHQQNTGTLSQNLRHSVYFRQWNQMEKWCCFNVREVIEISSMELTSEMETVKLTVLLRTVCLYGPLVYINKEEYRAYITKGMGTGLRTIVKNCKVMFC